MGKKEKIWKAVKKGDCDWQLDGESVLRTTLEPKRPKKGEQTIVRLTHLNGLGRFAEADFFIRLGDPSKPTGQGDLNSAVRWVRASLVEDLLWVDDAKKFGSGQWVLYSKATAKLKDDTSWSGTYEAFLTFPPGRHSIEIKIVSKLPALLRSLVLTGWEVIVR